MKRIILLLLLLEPLGLWAQSKTVKNWMEKDNYSLQPVLGLQLWSSYTMGAKVYDEPLGQYVAVDNRFNTQLRRSRLGVKGTAFERLRFNFTAAMDLVGRDVFGGTEGGMNNGGSPAFRLWNAYIQWQLCSKREILYLTVGYQVPQIGRESTNAALRSSSMEKSWSQNYLRRHLVGTGPGRTMGINLGGLLYKNNRRLNWTYHLGVFNAMTAQQRNSTGRAHAPLLVGRLITHWGAPVSKRYRLGGKTNFRGQRKGLSLGVAGARQGATDIYLANHAASLDLLFNWGPLNLDGEWTFLWRKGASTEPYEVSPSFTVRAQTGYLRLSYNIFLQNQTVLEPVLMWMLFTGEDSQIGQAHATQVHSLSGREQSFAGGLNWHLQDGLFLSLHYTHRFADAGFADLGATVNNYFYQAGAGAIHRGNWVGLGMVFIL